MASSQVEIVSSMPFDRVLKDHNPHDACTTTQAAFNENTNKTFDSAPYHSNTQKPTINNTHDTWVSRIANNNLGTSFFRRNHNKKEESSLPALVSPRHSRIIERWAARQAQETLENDHQDNKVLEDVPSRSSSFNATRKELIVSPKSSCVEDISNLGASSLVQIWEKRLNHFSTNAPASPGRSNNENAWAQVTRCIRGRRAFNDLLAELVNDRYRELNNLAQHGAVSKFKHRGRIQSLLRFRLLQRGVAVFGQSYNESSTTMVNSQPQGSAIMQLRETSSTEVEHKSSALVEVSDPTWHHRDIANKITQSDNSDTIDQLNKDSHCNTIFGTSIHCTEPTKNSMVQVNAENREESHPSSYVTMQGTFFEAQRDDDVPKEIIEASSSLIDSNANEIVSEVHASDHQQYNSTTETGYNDIAEMEDASNQQYAENSYYDEIAQEEEVGDQYYDEASYYDWMSPISRPRSYWEKLRQAWYREILDFGSDNEEIYNLLERRTVSTFLSSDFRERMDRLMESRVGLQTRRPSQDDVEDRQESSRNQMIAFFHEQLNFEGAAPEDGRDREREEEEKVAEEIRRNEEQEEKVEESITIDSDHETGYCFSHQSTPSSSSTLLRALSFKDNEVADDYDDRVACASSSQQPPQSESFYQDSRRQYSSSSTNHHSIEMEFLYDLRGQIDQLFHEMSELRKSLKICMDIQMQLQQLKNQEVYTVKEEEKFHDATPKRGKCRICNEKKVEAVLYRCGHMCTCLKCANELQSKGENCPICKAPIIDVVSVQGDI